MPDDTYYGDDDLERQLSAFGRSLEAATGEPIGSRSRPVAASGGRRRWAIVGAAAAMVAAVAGLVVVGNRSPDGAGPSAPPATTAVPFERGDHDATVTGDDELRTAPIADLIGGCPSESVVVSADYVETASGLEAAYDIARRAITEHDPATADAIGGDGWLEVLGEPVSVVLLDRGDGIEVLARFRLDGGVWHLDELAQCVTGDDSQSGPVTTTTVPDAGALVVPDDPLGLEADGWRLVERDELPFEFPDDTGCEGVDPLVGLDGVDQVHDIVVPDDGTGLDVDITVVDVGSVDVGNTVADAILALGECLAEQEGVAVQTSALSAIRASWFRAGPDFALATIVGESSRTVLLEIENGTVDDELIADLTHRAARYLAGDG